MEKERVITSLKERMKLVCPIETIVSQNILTNSKELSKALGVSFVALSIFYCLSIELAAQEVFDCYRW